MDDLQTEVTATFIIPPDLAPDVEQALAGQTCVVERQPDAGADAPPSFALTPMAVLTVIGTVATVIKALFDIHEHLLRRRERKQRVEVQVGSGAAISISADTDRRELEDAVRVRFARAT